MKRFHSCAFCQEEALPERCKAFRFDWEYVYDDSDIVVNSNPFPTMMNQEVAAIVAATPTKLLAHVEN